VETYKELYSVSETVTINVYVAPGVEDPSLEDRWGVGVSAGTDSSFGARGGPPIGASRLQG